MFRDSFLVPKYQDSPLLSDQLLLPNLTLGPDIFLVSSYVPSYLIRLLSDLAATAEVEPGHLSLTLYIPGSLTSEKLAILRLYNHLKADFDSLSDLTSFLENVLQLMAEGGLSLNVLHGKVSGKLSKGTLGVIVERSTNDYVSFEDSRPGDFNSPVVPLRSWLAEEISAAERLLKLLNQALDASRPSSTLVPPHRTGLWISAVHEHISKAVASADRVEDSEEFEGESDAETNGEPSELEEFESMYETYLNEEFGETPSDDDPLHEFFASGFAVEITAKDIEGHHVAPVPEQIVGWIGEASATCICGRKFRRIEGCPEVTW